MAAAELGPIDVVLLSHDQHGDNLDDAGRALLPTADVVLTTRAGATRLGGAARGLAPWQVTGLQATRLCRLRRPHTVLSVHYEGWRHFRQGREAVERAFARTPEPVRRAVRWLPPGVPVDVEV